MTADFDLSPEAVRLARERICGAVNDGWSIKADDVAIILDELDRLRAERAALWQAGAEAMREAARTAVATPATRSDKAGVVWHDGFTSGCLHAAGAIRALPIPDKDAAP